MSPRRASVRAVVMASACMAIAVAILAPSVAYASFFAGDCWQWSPKGNSPAKRTTTFTLHDVGGPDQMTLVASNGKTRFYFQHTTDLYSPGDNAKPVGSPARVTRNKFFALARGHSYFGRSQIFATVTWAWKTNAKHKRYRYAKTVTGTYYEQ